jgi:hypothetical protein
MKRLRSMRLSSPPRVAISPASSLRPESIFVNKWVSQVFFLDPFGETPLTFPLLGWDGGWHDGFYGKENVVPARFFDCVPNNCKLQKYITKASFLN